MVHFVGAGSGAPDLITVRGLRLLQQADVVIYAGSLVNPELLRETKPGCQLHNSASMTLEQVVEVIQKAEGHGLDTLRLHTGDPCLYGAIREQIDRLEQLGIPYDLTPGVSSFCGAAAALGHLGGAEYTLPGVSQSVIITRMAGRTPVPKRESIPALAAHRATMVIFLSAGMIPELVKQLLEGGYPPKTPAAIVYKATWPDEKALVGTLETLPGLAEEHGISKTALILVGEFLSGGYGRSKLYDPGFSHGFREATPMTLSIACFTEAGEALSRRLAQGLAAQGVLVRRRDRLRSGSSPTLGEWAAQGFAEDGALVFIGASGIAVRAIAPLVRDKRTDPAVVTVDEQGRFVVPLLSGHVGGANALARRVAALLGAQPVISTATDLNGRFAVDTWAAQNGVALEPFSLAKAVSAALLAGEPVGLASDFPLEGAPPEGFAFREEGELGLCVTLDGEHRPFRRTLLAIPRIVTLGIGCRRGAPQEALEGVVDRFLAQNRIHPLAVRGMATIDLKRDEPGLAALCARRGWPVFYYSAAQLAAVEGRFTPSSFVQRAVGVDNVCERAAALAGGRLLAGKYKGPGVTVAAAAPDWRLCLELKEDCR